MPRKFKAYVIRVRVNNVYSGEAIAVCRVRQLLAWWYLWLLSFSESDS